MWIRIETTYLTSYFKLTISRGKCSLQIFQRKRFFTKKIIAWVFFLNKNQLKQNSRFKFYFFVFFPFLFFSPFFIKNLFTNMQRQQLIKAHAKTVFFSEFWEICMGKYCSCFLNLQSLLLPCIIINEYIRKRSCHEFNYTSVIQVYTSYGRFVLVYKLTELLA